MEGGDWWHRGDAEQKDRVEKQEPFYMKKQRRSRKLLILDTYPVTASGPLALAV